MISLDRSVRQWVLTLLACAPLVLPICGGCASGDSAAEGDSRPTAVVTVGMVADIVENVGGERIQVVQLMGPGVDPHLYRATRDDVRSIMRGDIIFYAGLMLEGKMVDVLRKIERRRPVYAVAEAIDSEYLLQPDEFQGHYDPHVWMDVRAWLACVGVVEQGLVDFDPEHADEYRRRAAAYGATLERLHQYALDTLGTIPTQNRVLITSHDAFNYFGRAYDLQVIGVQGLSTESEAGLQQINALVDLLVERQVSAVFVESSVPRKNIQALVDGAMARGHQVRIGGELYSDAMGPAGTYEGTYVGMIEHNVNTVAEALGGTVPVGGFQATLGDRPERN